MIHLKEGQGKNLIVIPFNNNKNNSLRKYLTSFKDYLFEIGKSDKTIETYFIDVEHFLAWLKDKPGGDSTDCFTKTAVTIYIREYLVNKDRAVSTRVKAKAALSNYAKHLINLGIIENNPAREVPIPAQPLLAPKELTDKQRYVLRNLVERETDLRGKTMFALGYYAALRATEVSNLKVSNCQVGPKIGSIKVLGKGDKPRTIDIKNEVRKLLYDWLNERPVKDSEYVFTSQRNDRLSEAGIHYWFRKLKTKARKDEAEILGDITFHHLRHNWAHRALEKGWEMTEIAVYMGHITKRGSAAIMTTARYTQPSRETLREKLKLL